MYGKIFTILTDHNPLTYLNNITLSSQRLTRWRLKLAEYDFRILYRKGIANGNADALSRFDPPRVEKSTEDEIEGLFMMTSPIERDELTNSIIKIANKNKIDHINYSSKSILEATDEQAIAVCIPVDLKHNDGVAKAVLERFGGDSSLIKHKKIIGTCLVQLTTRVKVFLFTRQKVSDTSKLERLEETLVDLKTQLRTLKINHIAFAKHGHGLDKLDFKEIKALIEKVLIQDGFQCTVYLNSGPEKTAGSEEEEISLNFDEKIKRLQKKDAEIAELRRATGEGKLEGFILENGVLLKIRKGKNRRLYKQLVVPETLKQDVFNLCHDNFTGAHLGEKKTWVKLHNRFYWKGAYTETMDYVKRCDVCAKLKRHQPVARANLKPIVNFDRPFDKVVVDVLELTRSNSGNKYVVIFLDYLSRWVEAFPIRDQKATTIAKIFINEIVARYSAPKELLSDQV